MKPTPFSSEMILKRELLGPFDIIRPSLLSITSCSLQQDSDPSYFKQAVALPLLNKPNLDCFNVCNYRTISRLPFTSKVLENVVEQSFRTKQFLDPYQ